jgi:hypothetical protein
MKIDKDMIESLYKVVMLKPNGFINSWDRLQLSQLFTILESENRHLFHGEHKPWSMERIVDETP